MPHCDPDDLALRALGEPAGTAAADAHLTGCPQCRRDLDELRAVVAAGRAVTAEDQLVAPPDRVWDRIAGELGLGQHAAEPAVSSPHLSAVRARSHQPATTAPRAPGRWRWRGTAALVTAAAAAGLLAGLGIGSLGQSRPPEAGSPGRPGGSEPTVQARVSLQPLGDSPAEGRAVLWQESGRRSIDVIITVLPPAADGSYYEVWLIDRGVTRLVSLGPLDAERARFPVPSGLDLAAYPVLDVSVEAFDGDPGHSSDSVVRGVLPV